MDFERLKSNWQRFGLEDPLWAIATEAETKDNRWELDKFFEIGRDTIAVSMQTVLRERPAMGRGKALDFGCGAGRLTRGLEPFFDEVIGIDIAASMIEKARQLSPADSKSEYLVNERPDLGVFESSTFDFVLTFIVLQHMRQDYQKKYLAEFLRILRPGGLLMFQLPDYLVNEAGADAEAAGPVMEMYGMAPGTVGEVITEAGGVVINTEENGWAGDYVRSFTYLVEKQR